jgi:hypothetical protein
MLTAPTISIIDDDSAVQKATEFDRWEVRKRKQTYEH